MLPKRNQAKACLPNTSIRRYRHYLNCRWFSPKATYPPALNCSDTSEAQETPSLPRTREGVQNTAELPSAFSPPLQK